MSMLPRVTALTRERIAREFDRRGPDVCLAEINEDLRQNNPELLDMISKCASDLGDRARVVQGLGMFYRLLITQSWADVGKSFSSLLPRVTPETRDSIVRQIDDRGAEDFTRECLEGLEESNPELLQMAHNFASRHRDYLGMMQGFGLLYKALVLQSFADRAYLQ
jgi:hypothetical protein